MQGQDSQTGVARAQFCELHGDAKVNQVSIVFFVILLTFVTFGTASPARAGEFEFSRYVRMVDTDRHRAAVDLIEAMRVDPEAFEVIAHIERLATVSSRFAKSAHVTLRLGEEDKEMIERISKADKALQRFRDAYGIRSFPR